MNNIEDLEKTKKDSIELANKIFKTISHPEVLKITTPEERHEICIKKYELFSQAYPLVLAKMAVETRYNEIAFIKFLDRLYANPGKGIEGIIDHQASYAKYLYIEDCKKYNKRFCPKMASKIYESEYQNMIRWVNDTKKIEKKVKNEYEEESVKHDKELKEELKKWILRERENIISNTSLDKKVLEKMMVDDKKYQEHIKTNEIIVEENVILKNEECTEEELIALQEKEQRLKEALKQRELLENNKKNNEWINNPAIKTWKKKHNIK